MSEIQEVAFLGVDGVVYSVLVGDDLIPSQGDIDHIGDPHAFHWLDGDIEHRGGLPVGVEDHLQVEVVLEIVIEVLQVEGDGVLGVVVELTGCKERGFLRFEVCEFTFIEHVHGIGVVALSRIHAEPKVAKAAYEYELVFGSLDGIGSLILCADHSRSIPVVDGE